jgi:hypothetical protein
VQLFVGEDYFLFLGELLDAFLPTTTLESFEELAQAVRCPWRQHEVAAHDLLQQLALRAALLAGLGPQLLQESRVDLGSLLLGLVCAS